MYRISLRFKYSHEGIVAPVIIQTMQDAVDTAERMLIEGITLSEDSPKKVAYYKGENFGGYIIERIGN